MAYMPLRKEELYLETEKMPKIYDLSLPWGWDTPLWPFPGARSDLQFPRGQYRERFHKRTNTYTGTRHAHPAVSPVFAPRLHALAHAVDSGGLPGRLRQAAALSFGRRDEHVWADDPAGGGAFSPAAVSGCRVRSRDAVAGFLLVLVSHEDTEAQRRA